MSDNAANNTAASKPSPSPGDAADRLQGATKEAQGDQPSQSAEKTEKGTISLFLVAQECMPYGKIL